MSEPRHAMIFECDEGRVWLNMVPEAEGDDDRSPSASETYGPFDTVSEARRYADDNFQNTGFVIPLYTSHQEEIDDRVCLYYVVERLGDCIEYIETASDVLECPSLTTELYDFKRELVHALGANQLERKRNG